MSLNPGKRLKVEKGPNEEEEVEYQTQKAPSSPARQVQSSSRCQTIPSISREEAMDVFGTYHKLIQSYADQIHSQPRDTRKLALMCDSMEFSAQMIRNILKRDFDVSHKRQYLLTHVYRAHFEGTFRSAILHAREWSERTFPDSIPLFVHKGPWGQFSSQDAEDFNTQYFSATEEQWKIFIESPEFGFDRDTAEKLATHLGHEKWPILKAATNMPSMLLPENKTDEWKLVQARAKLLITEVAHASLLIG